MVMVTDEEDNKNMEPDYGDQFEDKKMQQQINPTASEPLTN